MNRLLLLATLALPLFGTGASAATLTFSSVVPDGTPNMLASETTGDVLENTSGSILRLKRSPFEYGATFDDDYVYTSVGLGSSATYDFGHDSRELSFIWGSPDDYNNLTFFKDGVAVEAIAISDYHGVNLDEAFATITTAFAFDSVRFSSAGNAFEFAGLSVSPIPLPAAGLLLIGALGVMGAVRRSRPTRA